ncbi:hypothetical protein KITKAT_53 [Arthrobacter phage Kitkat]|uniref:Uncharacterized protein n=1 Tax=Arthrobacter phage Kitkat TaxID=1796996 RepID=A0A140G6M9_9CAUD|nr:hypothetical protein BJD77_gp053 [Arthrobacter phage Kitkat]AMM44314.1 hypothetical protein KITKAT_53 [Arthrobacter phage Kitkat]
MTAKLHDIQSLHTLTVERARKAADTPQARYGRAILALANDGVMVLENYPMCCGSCASSEIAAAGLGKDDAVAWFINEQGHGIFWKYGEPWEREEYSDARPDERPKKHVWWNHSGEFTAAKITAAFRAEGFEVEWDGNPARCPTVNF